MEKIFLTILSMSTTASFVIVGIILIRLLLKKAPAIFSYVLWGVVLVKLVCPFSPEARFGIIPDVKWESLEKEVENAVIEKNAALNESVIADKNVVTENFISEISNVAELQDTGKFPVKPMVALPSEMITVFCAIWLIVGVGLIFYQVATYVRLKRNIGRRNISTPFVTGFLKPQIYLPKGLGEKEKGLVLAHERVHIRRKDYLIKPLAFFLCCVYWFNPFIWVAFSLMVRDMENACDEAVLKSIGMERKKEYAQTLLALSRRHLEKPCLIAFGEGGVKERIKRVMKMKKTKLWAGILATVVVFASCGLLFTNSSTEETGTDTNDEIVYYNYENALADANNEREQMIEDIEQEINLLEKQKRKIGELGEQENEQKQMEHIERKIKLLDEKRKQLEEETIAGATEEASGISKETKAAVEKLAGEDKFQALLMTAPEDTAYNDIAILYTYPVADARISDVFGTRVHPVTGEERIHSGVDFATDKGTPVTAAADGTVMETGFDANCGNYVILQHVNGDMSYYACCNEILKKEGEKVKQGEQIATVGNTGMSTGAHLHFAVSRNGNFIEPEFAA